MAHGIAARDKGGGQTSQESRDDGDQGARSLSAQGRVQMNDSAEGPESDDGAKDNNGVSEHDAYDASEEFEQLRAHPASFGEERTSGGWAKHRTHVVCDGTPFGQAELIGLRSKRARGDSKASAEDAAHVRFIVKARLLSYFGDATMRGLKLAAGMGNTEIGNVGSHGPAEVMTEGDGQGDAVNARCGGDLRQA